MEGGIKLSLERDLIHMHTEEEKLVSRSLVIAWQRQDWYEEPTVKHIVCMDEKSRELMGPVCEEDEDARHGDRFSRGFI